jgi:eukaryotic-like serine/threonine-protein kinase
MDKIGRYEIIRKLGSGGMGNVYLARDPLLDRKVAIKVLHAEFISDPSRLSRFIKEAKFASALEHPGVAHIYEIGESNGVHFISMQFVEGKTLSETMRTRNVTFYQILDWAIQICEAIAEAHANGMIHRDLKPQNIMITEQGHVKVLDFGIAKAIEQRRTIAPDSLTEAGVIVGTAQYMSPEQTLGKRIDHRSDIFSIGILLYEAVTGRLPFKGDTPVETLQKILNDPPSPFLQQAIAIPVEFERIILKCLQKNPDLRYRTTQDLLFDLRNLKEETSPERPTTSLAIAPPKSRWWQLAMTLLVIAALVAISFFQNKGNSIRSLAVLPFQNETANKNLDYLSDGITEEIINRLAQIPNLKVFSRASVFRYKGKQLDVRTLKRELGVDAIITGSFSQHADEVRVQVSLVKASEGTQMWGQLYTGKTSDIQRIQAELSRDVAGELPQKLTGKTRDQMRKQATADPVAYQLFLEGRFHLNKRTRENFQLAIRNFQEAIAHDPSYAAAYSGLADAYLLLADWGFLPAKQGLPKAKQAAEKALSLDNTLVEAHTSLAFIQASFEWDWKAADRSYQRAIALNPNYATAHQWYALYFTFVGKFDEALKEIRAAQQLDPFSMIINANVGYTLYMARRYDEAIAELKRANELDPHFGLTDQLFGYIYGMKRDYRRSIEALQKSVADDPNNLTFQVDLAWAYGLSGRTDKAQQMYNRLLSVSENTYIAPFYFAGICVGLKQNDRALEWLEKTYEQRGDQIVFIGQDPRFDPLRGDSRFKDLLHRIGL